MDGHQLLTALGFKQSEMNNVYSESSYSIGEPEKWIHETQVKDWVNSDMGEVMTQYCPEWRLEHILSNSIDMEKS